MPAFQCAKCPGIVSVSAHHVLGNRLKMKCEEQEESLNNYDMQQYTWFSLVILRLLLFPRNGGES